MGTEDPRGLAGSCGGSSNRGGRSLPPVSSAFRPLRLAPPPASAPSEAPGRFPGALARLRGGLVGEQAPRGGVEFRLLGVILGPGIRGFRLGLAGRRLG